MGAKQSKKRKKAFANVKTTESPEHRFKVLVLGGARAGKSSIFDRYIQGTFSSVNRQDAKARIAQKLIMLEGTVYHMELWDIPSDPKVRDLMAGTWFRDVSAAIIVADATDLASFQHIIEWTACLSALSDLSQTPAFLFVNKVDGEVRVSDIDIQDCVTNHALNAGYLMSAATSRGVEDAFEAVWEQLLVSRGKLQRAPSSPPEGSIAIAVGSGTGIASFAVKSLRGDPELKESL